MAINIVGVDSDYEDIVRLVAEHRRQNVYPLLRQVGFEVDEHAGNLATRRYIERSLSEQEVIFFTGSGHGLEDQITGNDRQALLEVGDYQAQEVRDKIVHLLACFTAFELGRNLVANGCKAFFGYDIFFTYYPDYINEFLTPDAEIDKAIAEGLTAREVHERAMRAYEDQINHLRNKGVHPAIVADMEANRDHLCSPVTNSSFWGDPNARLAKIIV